MTLIKALAIIMSMNTQAAALPGSAGPAQQDGPAHRVVFEVTSSKPKDWESAVRRIENLRKTLSGGAEIELIAYGPGLPILVKKKTSVGPGLSRLTAAGVRLAACSNSMRGMKVTAADLIEGAVPVDSGVAESVRRQEQGWSVLRIGAE